jgi:RNA polymerase sigma-70 factor (ECF subfamily)
MRAVQAKHPQLDQEHLVALVLRTARRDRAAFDELYRLVSPRLNRLAMYLTRRSDLTEEVLQDFFTTIWLRAGTYRPERGSVTPWMITILRNRVAALRRARALMVVPIEEASSTPSDLPSPQAEAELSEVGRRIAAAMEGLSPNIRRALVLAYFHDADYAEIATAMGVPVNTAKSWVRRGLERLRRTMEA